MLDVASRALLDRDPLPFRAAVVPRVRRPAETAALPIDEVVRQVIERQGGRPGIIVITGKPGSGRTTALRHLRAALGPDSLPKFFDSGFERQALFAARRHPVVLATESANPLWDATAVFELAPWTRDDRVEYLAAHHRPYCSAVLQRLDADDSLPPIAGIPQLLTLVMDRMAGDPEVATAHDAVRQIVPIFFPPGESTAKLAFAVFTFGLKTATDLQPEQERWWRHQIVLRVVATEWVADELEAGRVLEAFVDMQAREWVADVARAIRSRPGARAYLERLIRDDPRGSSVPMATSVLLAADADWQPDSFRRANLAGAMLRGARWPDADLREAVLAGADFSGADLRRADLIGVRAAGVELSGAELSEARIEGGDFKEANLSGARLLNANADLTDFTRADLSGANFSAATLDQAALDEATLDRAQFIRARLRNVSMNRTRLGGAEFCGADFRGAKLKGVDMSSAGWTGACFRGAKLRRCNLEGLDLIGADFRRANLTGSLLTASRIRGGHFRGACLRRTGLADIDWSNADLRRADLRHASFHMGSSRSGLVGSVLPCEGSKTGFYTDEFDEQSYKPPEEIRKACLRGADLRGAKVDHADFYLVDLRGARFTRRQGRVFARCGAILK